MNFERALQEQKNGLIFVCSMCYWYYKAKDAGLPNCGKEGCGSPIMSKEPFKSYDGLVSRINLKGVCWTCGDLRVYKVIEGCGLCKPHYDMMVKSGKIKDADHADR